VILPTARVRRAAGVWAAYAAAWVPFALLEMVSNALSSRGAATMGDLANWALWRTAISAVLGLGVWWLSGRIAFPDRGRVRFCALQLLLALAFAALWNGIWLARWAIGVGWRAALEQTGGVAWLGWGMMMGVWLYLIIAGIAYTLRVHRRLREQEVAAARTEALAARARLAALRSQLNPHFLFNSLHSLSTLVRHDAATAEEALSRLGDLLRYALDGAESDDVMLSEEWAFTRNYLALEELRLGSRLRLETAIAEDALGRQVPSFVLQPLAENAIRHGIAPRPEGGHLKVGAALAGNELVLEVADDGPGASPDRLADGRGHGLRVLRQRLETRYRGRARLDVDTAPGRGFHVAVHLPAAAPEPAVEVPAWP
jgi:signal transduction histidine kinase